MASYDTALNESRLSLALGVMPSDARDCLKGPLVALGMTPTTARQAAF